MPSPDPFSGIWKFNHSKSRLPWPAPQSLVTCIDADSEGIRVREEEVSDKGERSTVILEARFDGRDYPVAGSPFADAVSYKRIDLHNIKGAIKKAGKAVLNEAVVISADRKTMTSTYSQGNSARGFAVFDKQ